MTAVDVPATVYGALRVRTNPAALQRRGWVREAGEPGAKAGARWVHRDGWRLEHCGHPTALWPWLLLAPDGRWVLTGVLAETPDPQCGRAWKNLEMATLWVELAGAAFAAASC